MFIAKYNMSGNLHPLEMHKWLFEFDNIPFRDNMQNVMDHFYFLISHDDIEALSVCLCKILIVSKYRLMAYVTQYVQIF